VPKERGFPRLRPVRQLNSKNLIENWNFLQKKGYVVKKMTFLGEKSDFNVLTKVPTSSKPVLKLLCTL
jgi:hypothetical protein